MIKIFTYKDGLRAERVEGFILESTTSAKPGCNRHNPPPPVVDPPLEAFSGRAQYHRDTMTALPQLSTFGSLL